MARRFTLVTLLGIRPDIIRMHKLLRLLDQGQQKGGYRHVFVHSGQHYDFELDGVFYRQLGVRRPDWNLRVGRLLKKRGATSHVYQSGLLFEKTARMLESLRPDAVLFLGDTNTVLAALIVAKRQVPVIHLEGGGRSFDWRMPEEKNRITIDHLSDVIYCYLERYRQILLSEGVPGFRAVTTGNIIVDALQAFLPAAERRPVLEGLGLRPGKYALCTLHREENVEDSKALGTRVRGLVRLSRRMPVVFPVMPRVQVRLRQARLAALLRKSRVIQTTPLGFLDFLKLERHARLIITDSGTVQEEALLLGVPCVVSRLSTERPETLAAGATLLCPSDLEAGIRQALALDRTWDRSVLNPQGGSPSERIYRDLVSKIQSGFFPSARSYRVLRGNPFVRQAYGKEGPA